MSLSSFLKALCNVINSIFFSSLTSSGSIDFSSHNSGSVCGTSECSERSGDWTDVIPVFKSCDAKEAERYLPHAADRTDPADVTAG